jgi:hypothetical protein
MKEKNGRVLSRREFAQRAALLSATAPFASAEAVFPTAAEPGTSQAESSGPKLSEAGKAEADSRYQQILALYGARFGEEQKADLKKMCAELQPSLEHLRSYALQNGDAPALYLKPLVEREKKPQSPAAASTGEHS